VSVILPELEIDALLAESKPLPDDFQDQIRLRDKRGHREQQLGVSGVDGSEFLVILRQSLTNPLDFSAILAYLLPGSNQLFRLRRYNGRSHEHTNVLERAHFYGFHIHAATERYQESGLREDAYAEPTHAYGDYQGAVRTLFAQCGFEVPQDPQATLFGEGV
jgi:hypothetical protein